MKTIEVIDLEKLDSSAITVVDVRSSEDYSKGTFNNAISIPKSDFYNNVSNIEKNKPVYVLCYTGDNSVEIVDISMKMDMMLTILLVVIEHI